MTAYPVVRISKGHFAPSQYDEVYRLIQASAEPLIPALKQLRGLLYYHTAVDPVTHTVVNVSIIYLSKLKYLRSERYEWPNVSACHAGYLIESFICLDVYIV